MNKDLQKGNYFPKDVDVISRRIFHSGVVELIPKDQKLIAECMVLRIALAIDLYGEDSALAYRRALLSLKTIDAKAYFEAFKELYQSLTDEVFLKDGRWSDFKHLTRTIPKWIVAPLVRSHNGGDYVSLDWFGNAIQWTRFDSKLTISGISNDAAITDYLDDEWRMSHEPLDFDLLKLLNAILREWTSDFTPDAVEFQPCHGSGAVAGLSRQRATPSRKTRDFRVSEQDRRYEAYRTPFEEPRYLPEIRGGALSHVSMDNPCVPERDKAIFVEFVPKDALKRRVVSPEDSLRMFYQGDAARLIVPWLNNFHWCDLDKQELSQNMCVNGSRDGRYVTVDSSRASDLVRHSHLKVILEGTPLWPLYELTRSNYAWVPDILGCRGDLTQEGEPLPSLTKRNKDKVLIRLEKACPMGSRVCFLMEELVFGLCCELAVRRTAGRRSRRGDFRVYGDDVIISSSYWPQLRLILSLMRFRVNDDKTFAGTGKFIFREACGVFSVNGHDVTPCMISRRYKGISHLNETMKFRKEIKVTAPDAAEACGVLDLMNRCMLHGLYNTRRWLHATLSGEWITKVWRITLQDYLRDRERFKRNLPPISEHCVPSIITYDHVDENFHINMKTTISVKGVKYFVPRKADNLVIRQVKPSHHNDVYDLYHWLTMRVEEANDVRQRWEYSYLERLTYCGPGLVKWHRAFNQ